MFSGAVRDAYFADVIGMIGLLIALAIFLIAVVRVMRLSKKDIDRFSRLPLESDPEPTPPQPRSDK